MRTVLRAIPAAVALLLLASGGVLAQDAPPGLSLVREGDRGGVWGGLSLGAGGEAFDLRDGLGYSENLYRPTVSLRLGGTVNQSLRLGGEALAWINERDYHVESLTSLLFIGQVYPIRTSGLYLKGGLGLGRNAVEFDGGETSATLASPAPLEPAGRSGSAAGGISLPRSISWSTAIPAGATSAIASG